MGTSTDLTIRAVQQQLLKEFTERASLEGVEFNRAVLFSLMNYLAVGQPGFSFDKMAAVPSATRERAFEFINEIISKAQLLNFSVLEVADTLAQALVWTAKQVARPHLF